MVDPLGVRARRAPGFVWVKGMPVYDGSGELTDFADGVVWMVEQPGGHPCIAHELIFLSRHVLLLISVSFHGTLASSIASVRPFISKNGPKTQSPGGVCKRVQLV